MKVTTVERMVWTDPVIADVPVPTGKLTLRSGFGSGLGRRPSDPADTFWAIGDRGPNLKVAAAIKRYGLVHLEPLRSVAGAKVMPRPDIGPAIAQFRIVGDEVKLVRELRLTTEDGMPISGLAHPGSDALLSEPVFDLSGAPLAPSGSGTNSVRHWCASISTGTWCRACCRALPNRPGQMHEACRYLRHAASSIAVSRRWRCPRTKAA
jgi:hypothetical protein